MKCRQNPISLLRRKVIRCTHFRWQLVPPVGNTLRQGVWWVYSIDSIQMWQAPIANCWRLPGHVSIKQSGPATTWPIPRAAPHVHSVPYLQGVHTLSQSWVQSNMIPLHNQGLLSASRLYWLLVACFQKLGITQSTKPCWWFAAT